MSPPDEVLRRRLRVVIVAENASTEAGGEALLPLQYFRRLNRRGVEAHLVTHSRNSRDLLEQVPELADRLHFTGDRLLSRLVQRVGMRLPHEIKPLTVWLAMSLIGAVSLRSEVRRLVRRLSTGAPEACEVVVHQPAPVSPRQPSFMTRLGAPVVIGPLNGGMSYPDGFVGTTRRSERVLRGLLRAVAEAANLLVDGKRRAAVILVANDRTRRALPRVLSRVTSQRMVENGVDLTTFSPRPRPDGSASVFAYVGRLVNWKRVDLVLTALTEVPEHIRLEVVGAGPAQRALEQQCAELGLTERVRFHGAASQQDCAAILARCAALVLPSVYESGGAVLLEAMAVGRPVIAIDWGGPADYVIDGETGILIEPTAPEAVGHALSSAMIRLAGDPELAAELGDRGRERAERLFDWERRIDSIVTVYDRVASQKASARR